MAEIATIARPYAEAVFRLAKESNALGSWSEQLAFAQLVAADSDMQRLAADPKVDGSQLGELFLSVSGSNLGAEAGSFVKLLIENGRISVLPEIVTQFETLKANEGGVLEADVTSAFAMSTEQIAELSARLEKKFNRKINATVTVDTTLIGGIIVAVGDEVYDASVRGKLQGMAYALKR
ncbi:F0F1 ATP synthase subunit delta [Sulfuriferula sp. AH1]|uniref:F0F1 ATP synthase subunit delta n=1 Tax=Sulfuriferula sp. AH1 TaxID=1985873 RepID=UPI000B3B8CBC|nr:F0F1 ATP synthase subunit delta [Sulfuriferula sp. AH1]ARU32754.1 F0F1 ATP synthase subunit delta [Sulfuriferula sp. AH1]